MLRFRLRALNRLLRLLGIGFLLRGSPPDFGVRVTFPECPGRSVNLHPVKLPLSDLAAGLHSLASYESHPAGNQSCSHPAPASAQREGHTGSWLDSDETLGTAWNPAMIAQLPNLRIPLQMEKIASFCRRWNIARLEVFGSVLRDDFRPDSDLDLVATYAPQARWSLLDRVSMKLELEALVGRQVDLLNHRALEKAKRPLRAAAILAEAQPLYAES